MNPIRQEFTIFGGLEDRATQEEFTLLEGFNEVAVQNGIPPEFALMQPPQEDGEDFDREVTLLTAIIGIPNVDVQPVEEIDEEPILRRSRRTLVVAFSIVTMVATYGVLSYLARN